MPLGFFDLVYFSNIRTHFFYFYLGFKLFMAILFFLILVVLILAFFLFRIDKFLKKKLTKNFFYKPENKK